jgi:hypothetical protein
VADGQHVFPVRCLSALDNLGPHLRPDGRYVRADGQGRGEPVTKAAAQSGGLKVKVPTGQTQESYGSACQES